MRPLSGSVPLHPVRTNQTKGRGPESPLISFFLLIQVPITGSKPNDGARTQKAEPKGARTPKAAPKRGTEPESWLVSFLLSMHAADIGNELALGPLSGLSRHHGLRP